MAVVGFAASTGAAQSDDVPHDNQGTIKIHDNETADPDRRNEPHVSCDFWVEGFNMESETGQLHFYAWPPTGDKEEVVPGGDSRSYDGELEDDEDGYHFLNGPYFLPDGHYRVEAVSDDGHPGGNDHVKSKTFWVDECEEECVEDCGGEPCVEDCKPPACEDDEETEEDECNPDETEVPFFPSAVAGAVGLLGCVGAYTVMRRNRG